MGVVTRPLTLYISWLAFGRCDRFKIYEDVIFVYASIAEYIKPKERNESDFYTKRLKELCESHPQYPLEVRLFNRNGCMGGYSVVNYWLDNFNKRIVLMGEEKH